MATAVNLADFERGKTLPRERLYIVFSGLVLSMLLAALDSTIVATALPTIVSELGGLAHISWVVTAYLLAQTVVTPLYGKLGDLYGRKRVMQSAIVLFLAGSALSGLSGTMFQLIVFRAVQGLGGGGIVVTTQAVVGDIVAPRERGRYQGIFGAVFGVASIAGPLIGGYFTSNLSWRWIFYVNLPIGAIALTVIGLALPPRRRRAQHRIDYAGAALLAAALAGIVLVSDIAGSVYPWSSPIVIGALIATAAALALFVAVEKRAAEPVLPLALFKNRTFVVACIVGIVIGFALFGAVTYMPIFFQVVKGGTPTRSGLEMVPMMGGMLVTSIVSGQIISHAGRYRFFPILGTAVATLGLYLIARLSADSTVFSASMRMLVLGLGLGGVMQVLIMAVQNAVDYADLGAATSGATLFRLVGGSIGTAVLGAIFSASLTGALPSGAALGDVAAFGPETLARMPPDLRAAYAGALMTSLNTMFFVAAAVSLAGFAFAWLLPEQPLKMTLAAGAAEGAGRSAGRAFAQPTTGDSLPEVLGGIIALANRDVQRRYIAAIIARAGVDLSPAAAWLLIRLEEKPSLDIDELARSYGVETSRLHDAQQDLVRRGFVTANGDGKLNRKITPEGCAVFNRLARARREHLAEICAEWPAGKREELAAALRQVVRQIVPEAHAPQ
jgi:EmrB/QacA subfamily drug resistance transporter